MATTAEGAERDFGFTRERGRRNSLLPDPKHVWMVFRRRLWLFVVTVLLVLSAVAAVVLTTEPVYTATASVLIEPRKTEAIDLQSVVQGLPADTNVVDTQTQIIGSPTTALGVVRRLRLDQDDEFAAQGGGAEAKAEVGGDPTAAERSATAAVLGKTNVTRVGLTYVIQISVDSRSAEKAAEIANAFAAEYIALQEANRASVNVNTADIVGKRADELRAEAVADEAAVQRYKIANNLMSAEGATMAEQEVSQLNQQIAEAKSILAQERGKLAAARGQISRGGGGADVGAVLGSDTIRSLRAQESVASAELASLESRYGPLHPDVKKAKQNLADVQDQVAAESRRIISTLQANVEVAQSRVASLEASRSGARSSLASNSSAQVGLLELERKAEASRAIYSAFLQRAKETAATANLPQADARISSLARAPGGPSWPNYRLAALFGLLAAGGLGLIAVGAAEYLDGTVSTRDEIESELGVPYAGAIPDLQSSAGKDSLGVPPYVYVLSHPFSAFAEAVRSVAAFATRRKTSGPRIVAIASALPREGKTSLAISMARLLALGGRRVVLVDGDLRRHSVSDALFDGDEGDERLLRVLDGSLPLSEALVKDPATELMVLPTCGPTTTEDYLTSDHVARLYAMLREEFDVVVVDTAPVLGIVDARSLTEQADATLVICHWRHTALKAVRAAVDVLEQSGANVVGVSLSMVDIRQYASTGHSDTYGYHKKFAGYYVN